MTKEEYLNGMSEDEFYAIWPTKASRKAWEAQQQMAYGGSPDIMGIPFGAGMTLARGGQPCYDCGGMHREVGGSFVDDGSYPMLNYGEYDGGPSPFGNSQFPATMRGGGDTTSQGGNQDFINNQKNEFLSTLQNNVAKSKAQKAMQAMQAQQVQRPFMNNVGGFNSVDSLRNSFFADKAARDNAQQMANQNFNNATGQFATNLAPIIAQNKAMNSMFEGALDGDLDEAQTGKEQKDWNAAWAQGEAEEAQRTASYADDFKQRKNDYIENLRTTGKVPGYNQQQYNQQQSYQQPNVNPWQQLADAFGPNTRRNGLPYFPANISRGYGLSNKNYDKLYGMTQNDKLTGASISYGPLGRSMGKFGRKLFGPSKISLNFDKLKPSTGQLKSMVKLPEVPREYRPPIVQSNLEPRWNIPQMNSNMQLPSNPGSQSSFRMSGSDNQALSEAQLKEYGGGLFTAQDGIDWRPKEYQGTNYQTPITITPQSVGIQAPTVPVKYMGPYSPEKMPAYNTTGALATPEKSVVPEKTQAEYDQVGVDLDNKYSGLKQAFGQWASPAITKIASNIDKRRNIGRDEKTMAELTTAGTDLSSLQAIPAGTPKMGSYDPNSGKLQPNNYNPASAWRMYGGALPYGANLPMALSGLEVKMQNMRPGLYGTNGNRQFSLPNQIQSSQFSEKGVSVRDTLQPVARAGANLEAEGGETAVVNVGGMPAHFKIGGPRHSQGGTPLNLPDDSFIFSDTAKMKIKDPAILAQFGMAPKKGGYTPAEIAKKYDINKFRKVLADKDSEAVDRKTAEMMIANYNLKLAKLALVQESMKGFPQGIPAIAQPYIESMEIDPAQFMGDQAQEQLEGAEQPDAETGEARYGAQITSTWDSRNRIPLAQDGRGFNPGDDQQQYMQDTWPMRKEQMMADNIIDPLQETSYLPEPQPTFVGKGWGSYFPDPSGDMMAEAAFSQTDKATYDVYREAMLMPEKTPDQKDKKKKQLIKAHTLINKGLEYQTGIGDFTSAGKTKDLRMILYEEFTRLNDPEAYKAKFETTANKTKETNKRDRRLDAEKAATVYEAIAHYARIRDRALAAGDNTGVKNAQNELDALYELDPSKQTSWWDESQPNKAYKVLKGIPALSSAIKNKDFKDLDLLLNPNLMYDQAESIAISKYEPLTAMAKAKAKAKEEVASTPDPTEVIKQSLKDKEFDWTKPTQKQMTDLYYNNRDEYDYLMRMYDTYPEMKKALFEKDGGSIYITGGSLLLPKMKNGDHTGPVKVKGSSGAGASGVSDYNLTPEEEEVRRQRAISAPETFVTDEHYDELERLYQEGLASSNNNPNLDTQATRNFQKRYHELLPDEARRIIAKENIMTNKGKRDIANKIRRDPFNLDDNLDGMFGPRTKQYWQAVRKKSKTPVKKLDQDINPAKQDNTWIDRGKVPRHPPIDLGVKPYAPWWLQDIVGISGAYGDLARIQQSHPWRATPAMHLGDVNLYDPTRRLAANAEQANLASQYHQAFTGPKSGAISQVQGKGMTGAADTLGEYDNLNVGVLNQFYRDKANTLNQFSHNQALSNTGRYNDENIGDQQRISSENKARENLRQSYINGLTNRGKTQALNTMNDNFYVDPSSGGYVTKTGYASVNPTRPGTDHAESMWEKAKKMNPTDPNSTFRVLMGQKQTGYDDYDQEAVLRSQYPGRTT